MSANNKKWIFTIVAIGVLVAAIAFVFARVFRGTGEPSLFENIKGAAERDGKQDDFRFGNGAEEKRARYPGKVERKELEEAIDAAAAYLVGICDSEGKFTYRVNIDPKVKVQTKYNMLRHAGTIFSLVDYYNWRKDEQVLDTLTRSLEFIEKNAFGPVPEQGGLYAVWSPPELVGRKSAPLQAKLGGTALGLVAALGVEKLNPAAISLDELKQMGRFIAFMQKEDGSFYSKYIPEKGGRDDSWTSLYYPGEAALALVMLYEREGSDVWLNAALRALGYLARMREGKDEVEPDHWALIATGKLLRLYEKTDQSVSRDLLEKHTLQIVYYMMKTRPSVPDTSPLYGMLISEGRTTPIATRLEGLLAVFDFASRVPSADPDEVAEAIRGGIAFLVRSQIRNGKFKGGIPRSIRREHDAPRGDNERATEIRIDYVQHALSAMIRYARSPLAD
jgi:hypothetical protein